MSRRPTSARLVGGAACAAGIAIMAALTTALWLLDIRHFGPPADKWSLAYLLRILIGGLVAGLAVGLIEETFFRGLLHTGMRRSLGFWSTATLTALLYAALHFMKPEALGDTHFDSTAAFGSITAGFGRIADFAPISDSFITLVIVGIFLSMVRERTGNILWAIAIHAGWVMIIKLAKYLTNTSYVDGQASFWVGEYDHITGWMATLWLGLIAMFFWHRWKRAASRGSSGAARPSAAGHSLPCCPSSSNRGARKPRARLLRPSAPMPARRCRCAERG